jgi:hypothetical protein
MTLLLSIIASLLLLITSPAIADIGDKSYEYAPDGCEFTLTLPGEPYTVKRCLPDDDTKCSLLTSFTHVFGMEASINFNMSCNPSDIETFNLYNNDFMKIVLSGMISDQNLEHHEVDFDLSDDIKRAVVMGVGEAGISNKIYAAELWVGKSSVLTIEGELIGDSVPIVDEMFSDILRSIKQVKLGTAGALTDKDKEETPSKDEVQKPEQKPEPEEVKKDNVP